MQDFRYAVRALGKSGASTVVAVVALALGIGANTAIFSVVNAIFLRPLPYPDAGRLVEIAESRGGGRGSVSYPNYLDWQKQADVFEGMAATTVADVTLVAGGNAERLPVNYVASGFFQILHTKLLLGRDFTPQDDRAGAAPVVVLTHSLWQTRFGADPSAIGRTLTIDKASHTVIGVLPPAFRFYRSAQAFVPVSNVVTRRALYLRSNHNNLYVVARLRPGVTLERAQAQMDTIASRLEKEYPEVNTGRSAKVATFREVVAGSSRRPLLLLLGIVGMVLLIACVNVTNLLLARAADRRKEMALRAALGASRRHVLRLLLTESVVLAVVAGALALLFASWSFSGLLRLVPASLVAGGLSIDLRVLGFTLLVSLLTGLLFGMAPALDALRLDLNGALRDGARTTGASSRGRLRDALVVSEVALALVLLAGAGLLLRTLNQLVSVRLGFQTENMLTMSVSLPDSEEFSPPQASIFFDRLIERVQAMPGVRAAGAVSHLPLSGFFASAVFYRDDRPLPERGKLPAADQRVASPDYFSTMRIPLLKGRLFTPADGRVADFRRDKIMEWFAGNAFAVVINKSMANSVWPGEDPIGRTFRFSFPGTGGPRLTVIGVVGDTRDYGPAAEAEPTFYFSGYHFPRQKVALVVRTGVEPAALASSVRRAAAELDPAALVSGVTTMETLVSNSMASRRLSVMLLGIFAGLALLLAGIGVYGVMAYAVNRRRHEIGVRMTLGAARADVLRLVIGRAALLGALGVAIGSAAGLGLTRLIANMLYGVGSADPLTFTSVAALLMGVVIAASFAPALRATQVSPLTALRSE